MSATLPRRARRTATRWWDFTNMLLTMGEELRTLREDYGPVVLAIAQGDEDLAYQEARLLFRHAARIVDLTPTNLDYLRRIMLDHQDCEV